MASNKTITISIARDFSRVPAGRYTSDGKNSGQVFRERHLVPALQAGDQLVVDLDDTEGYGSSFLEEAFGGLIRDHGFSLSEIRQKLSFESSEDPSLISEINEYIDEASARSAPKRGS